MSYNSKYLKYQSKYFNLLGGMKEITVLIPGRSFNEQKRLFEDQNKNYDDEIFNNINNLLKTFNINSPDNIHLVNLFYYDLAEEEDKMQLSINKVIEDKNISLTIFSIKDEFKNMFEKHEFLIKNLDFIIFPASTFKFLPSNPYDFLEQLLNIFNPKVKILFNHYLKTKYLNFQESLITEEELIHYDSLPLTKTLKINFKRNFKIWDIKEIDIRIPDFNISFRELRIILFLQQYKQNFINISGDHKSEYMNYIFSNSLLKGNGNTISTYDDDKKLNQLGFDDSNNKIEFTFTNSRFSDDFNLGDIYTFLKKNLKIQTIIGEYPLSDVFIENETYISIEI